MLTKQTCNYTLKMFATLTNSPLLFDCSLCGGEAGDGHPEGRAGHIVQADPVAELHRGGVTAVLAADTQMHELHEGVKSVTSPGK